MQSKEFLLRETCIVSPNNGFNYGSTSYKVLNITLDLGKTLQDVKYADCSGGYVYNCSDGVASARVRNRVIYWRSHQCTLELVEECLDSQLRGSRVKLAFSDTPVLDVHIAELCTDVYLLVSTTGGLVRFLLHHPAQLKEAASPADSLPYSVLHSISSSTYQVCQPRGAPFRGHVRSAAAWLNPADCSAYAAYGLSGGDIQVLRMQPPGQQLQQRLVLPTVELRQSSLFDRLLGGWIPLVGAGGGGGAAGVGGSGGGGGAGSGGGIGAGEVSADDAATSLAFWAAAALSDDPAAVAASGPVILLAATRDHKLRLWDTEKRECYCALDLLAALPDPAGCGPLHNRGHQIRLCRGAAAGRSLVGCLYANFTERPCFLALESPSSAAASSATSSEADAAGQRRLRLRLRRPVQSPGRDLLEFAMDGETAWAVFADPQVVFRLYGVGLGPGRASSQPLLARCQLLEADQAPLAPRDHASRLTRAFGGREFAPDSVRRSLRLFLDENSLGAHLDQLEAAAAAASTTSDDPAASGAPQCSLEFMRSLLLDAADTLAQEEAPQMGAAEPEDAEALDDRRAWHVDRFYGQLLQLHAMDTAVCGLVADWDRSGFLGLVRRRFLGLLRPADTAELCHLLPESEGLGPEALGELPAFEDPQGTRDFLTAVTACQRLLETLEPPGLPDLLMGQLLQLTLAGACQEAPSVAGRACRDPLVRRACHTIGDSLLLSLCEPVSAFATLLTALEAVDFLDDVDLTLLGGHQPQPPALQQLVQQTQQHQPRLLSAWSSAELLSNALSQTVDSRLRLLLACLLLFAQLPDRFADLCPELEARAADLLKSLGLLRWCCDLVYSPAPPRVLESLRAQLALLLTRPQLDVMDAAGAAACVEDCPALAVWFAYGGAGHAVRRLLPRPGDDHGRGDIADEADGSFGRELLPTSVSLLHNLLSPERGGLSFPLFLLWSGQLEQLHAYTAMCAGWVRSDPATLYAARGLALLNRPTLSDLPEAEALSEAVDCLGQAVQLATSGAREPPPLCQPGFLRLVGLSSVGGDSGDIRAGLFVHLVRVLEPLRCSEQIVGLARLGLSGGCGRYELPLRATVFKHELQLGSYQSALDAMLQLGDPSAQLDCIRHLVVTLSDRDQLGALLSLNFGHLGNALVSVLEMRARAVDAGLHVYYNLLYCYHCARSDYKRAAGAMHELSLRLARDRGFEAAQRQARALLSAVGCLRLLEPRHRWVAAPEDFLEEVGRAGGGGASVQDEEDDEDEARPVRVLTLADLELRYADLSARLQLSLRQPQQPQQLPQAAVAAAPLRGLDELTADLLSAGLYHEAKCLLVRHHRAPTPLLEALATAAVTASGFVSTTEEALAAVKEALEEEGASAEGAGPADCLWTLLQLYAERYDWPGSPGLRAVAQRLMLLDYPAPAWLTRLFADRDPAGLLRLYIAHDRVEEAAELSRRLVDTARLAAMAPDTAGPAAARCLPYTQILQVREGLRLLGPPAQAWYGRLQASLADYCAACDRRLTTA